MGRIAEEEVIARTMCLGLDGTETHTEQECRAVIRRLLQGEPDATFGIAVASERARWFGNEDHVFALCQRRLGLTSCDGYLALATEVIAHGLIAMATALVNFRKKGAKLLFGTGHPGTLLDLYICLANWYRSCGNTVLVPPEAIYLEGGFALDFVGGVAVVSDSVGLYHVHDPTPCEMLLESYPVDAAVVDHGFVGPCINRSIPVIAVTDADDAALVVVEDIVDVTLVPLNDNACNHVLRGVGKLILEMLHELDE